jgi:NAD(P)-dependent dehydrogenase (short-subunit alcohol dehydrogenase family)
LARIFITGSADGLGELSAKILIDQGHQVVLHARNAERGRHALAKTRGAEEVLIGDLSDIDETKALALRVNAYSPFDAVIHNAGVYQTSGKQIVAVNTLAPYILTSLIKKPKRLIYLTSGLHANGQVNLPYLRKDMGRISYSDSKLHVVMLAFAAARKWKDVYSNAVNPGWVPTKMGGKNAPDDLQQGYETQTWLAVSNDKAAKVSGRYFFHRKENDCNPVASNVSLQDSLLLELEALTGISFPD